LSAHEQVAYRRFLSLLPRNYWLLRSVIDGHLEPLGLSNAQWRPLLLLWEAREPMTQVQIARALGMESPTLVRLLDRLGDKGWVARHHCPGDRRAYHVALTPAARALCVRIDRVLTRLRAEILRDFTQAELTRTLEVLERLHLRLEGLDGALHSGQGKAADASVSDPGTPKASNRMRGARSGRRSRKPPF
jgi:MarR family transcriptional regulator, transcriptional regulator for hemolysin